MKKQCDYCKNEFETKSHRARYCSDAHKMADRRNNSDKKNIEPTREAKISTTGHWFGRAPHKPIWLECKLGPDKCPYNHNEQIDWEPTCTAICCKYA